MIVAPLAMIGPARGAIVVARMANAPAFAPADVTLVSTFAAQAAATIELFELRSAETHLAAAAERQRIAGDLHDGIVAALRELHVGLVALAAGQDDRLARGIDEAGVRLDSAIAAIGAFVLELRTPPPETAGHGPPAAPVARALPGPVVAPARGTPAARRSGTSRTIAVIGELARAAAANDATDGLLRALVDEVVARTGATLALIGTLTESGDTILVRTRFGPDLPGRRVGELLPVTETLVGRAITEGRPVVVSPSEQPPTGVPGPVAAQVGALVVVPLAIRGHHFGALAIGRPAGATAFSASEVGLIEAYGAQAAIALEFERVRREIRIGSVSNERDRIGRDLHERVIQLLFGVAFALQALESTVRNEAVRVRLQAIVEALDRAIRDLRRFVFGLGPGPGPEGRTDERIEALAADNARLQAEIEAQLREVRASRRRILAAGDAERKRVERDLHDGAQQRIVSLALALRLARSRLGDDLDPSAKDSLDQAADDAKAALAELRELARGIHPQILTEAGLGPAILSLAARSPIAVEVEIGDHRYPAAVEGAVYFTISEGLANIAKYAGAGGALVRVEQVDQHLAIEIVDDGVGGADPASGSGLRGLADRLDAINGSLEVHSPLGAGTRLVARIPLETAPVAAWHTQQ
jgi:signal transduction histidine kinase